MSCSCFTEYCMRGPARGETQVSRGEAHGLAPTCQTPGKNHDCCCDAVLGPTCSTRSFPVLSKVLDSSVEVAKNLLSGLVWMPLSASASPYHLPAVCFHSPAGEQGTRSYLGTQLGDQLAGTERLGLHPSNGIHWLLPLHRRRLGDAGRSCQSCYTPPDDATHQRCHRSSSTC